MSSSSTTSPVTEANQYIPRGNTDLCARKEDDPGHSTHWDWNMSDYTTATGHDSEIVEITDPNQIRYWCHLLGCTEAQLRESVQAVGHSPAEVRQFLHDLSQRGVF